MKAVFSGCKRLLPCSTDLSFYNWATQTSRANATEGFEVMCNLQTGAMLFKSKRDRKAINVDHDCAPGDNSTRTNVDTDEYLQVVIYDHIPRRHC